MTLRARLSLVYGATIVCTVALVGALVWWQFQGALRGALDQTLSAAAVAAVTGLENGQAGLQEGDLQARSGVFLAQFDQTGALIDATSNAPGGLSSPPVRTTTADVALGQGHYATSIVPAPGGGWIVAGSSLAPLNATLEQLASSLLLVGSGAAIASLAGGWWLAGRALRPVATLTREASQIDAGDLDRRLPVAAVGDEIGALTATLNSMLDRVAESVRRQRRFVAAASHDLRTPIAALQAELELATDVRTPPAELRLAVQRSHGDAVRLGQLAAALLELAAVEPEGRSIVRSEVDVGSVIESVIARTESLARARSITVRHEATSGRVHVDRLRLEQALTNLVTNAITHGPANAEVSVVARIESPASPLPSQDRQLLIEVLDRGDGVPADVAASLFEPFQRGSTARGSGAGLGLATAAAAIHAQHGAIGVAPRDGGGTRFWVRLPV